MASKLTVNVECTVLESVTELSMMEQELVTRAKAAADMAYAPYSNFLVGAAVLLENEIIITGNNQENAAYPSGLCAERVAIFYASSQYPGVKVKTIAVTARTNSRVISSPVTPCGACRQSILEYEVQFNSPVKIIMTGEEGKIYISDSVKNLLPFSFSAKDL